MGKSKHVCDSLQLSCCCRSLALHRGLTSWLPKFQLSEYMEPVGVGGGGLSHLELGCLSLAVHLSRKQKSMAKWKKVSLTLLLFYFLTIVTERERGERVRVSVICNFLFCYKMQVLEHQASKHICADVSRPPIKMHRRALPAFVLCCWKVHSAHIYF